MIKRVVFFQPKTLARDNYQNSTGAEQTWVPWFALILSPAAKQFGCAVELVDARLPIHDWEDRIGQLGTNDVLAVTVMTGHAIVDALKASSIAKSNGAFVVWGGPHVTLFPDETLSEAPVSAVIPGFGLQPFQNLIKHLTESRTSICEDPNVRFKERSTRPASEIPIVPQTLPPPHDLDLIKDWSGYLNQDSAIASRTINFVTSEGCPRRCTFCSEPTTSGQLWVTRSVGQSVTVASRLVNVSGANGLKLHDPNFFHDSVRAMHFAEQFSKSSGVPWAATLYPDDLVNMSDQDLRRFASFGLSRVLIGLESPIADIVRLAGKKYDPSQIPTFARRLAEARIRGMFTFIVGWPGAASNHYQATIESAYRIKQLWSEHQAKIHFLEPWPGTPIYNLAIRSGFVAPRSLLEWAQIDYYQAQFAQIHDLSVTEVIRHANSELSPYVDA